MGHRHCPHSFRMPMNQGHDGSHSTAEQPHSHTGRAPENGSLLHLQDNVSRVGVSSSLQWSSGSRAHDYPSRYGMQIQQFQPSHSAAYDPVSSASRNLYLGSQGDGGFGQSNYNEICHTYNDGSGLQDSAAGSRRGYKRKSPDSSIVCERGSTSGVNGAGSSSSSELQLPISGYQNVSSSHIGLPYCGGGVAINGDDPMRNVRSRSRLDLEASTMRNRFSSHSSHSYRPTSNPSGHYGAVDLNHTNVNETNRVWSFNTLPSTDGRTQISVTGTNESNQLIVRGVGTDNCYPRPISGPNRNVVSSRQYHHRAPPYWGARGGHGDLPGQSNPRFAGEAVSASNPLQSHPGTYSSRYSAQSTGGWRNYHRNGRSHAAVGRSRSVSHRADAHYRTGSEDFTVMDGSSLNVRSRSSFDQYRSLRVDVDNMTYEELLALGERIGSVNTGLSEDMISKCLIEATNSLVDQNQEEEEEENCCICLEEYSNTDGVGTIRNCGHKYHASCIRKWLSMKNACPICKTPALGDASKT